jgi:yecA family protein
MTDALPKLNYIFDDFADMFVELGAFGTPSELHGLLAGQLAAGVRADAEAWLAMVVAHLDVQELEDDDKAELVALYDLVLEQFTAADFGFQLLLPEDDAELTGRTESLGAWCSGFLSGFGLGFDSNKQKLSNEITDAMEDIASIAQVSFDTDDTEDEEQEGYNAEASYIELVEYVRLAAMMVFAEFNLPTGTMQEDVPQLH